MYKPGGDDGSHGSPGKPLLPALPHHRLVFTIITIINIIITIITIIIIITPAWYINIRLADGKTEIGNLVHQRLDERQSDQEERRDEKPEGVGRLLHGLDLQPGDHGEDQGGEDGHQGGGAEPGEGGGQVGGGGGGGGQVPGEPASLLGREVGDNEDEEGGEQGGEGDSGELQVLVRGHPEQARHH